MTRLIAILLAAGLAAAASTAPAGETTRTDAPLPASTSPHPERIKAILEVLAQPESIDNLVRFTKGYYEALLAAGFTQDQAVRIVVGTGIPGLD